MCHGFGCGFNLELTVDVVDTADGSSQRVQACFGSFRVAWRQSREQPGVSQAACAVKWCRVPRSDHPEWSATS